MSTACDAASAFDRYGIPDGIDLLHRTHYRLLSTGDATFEPTPDYLARVGTAFRVAYRKSTPASGVPVPLDAAIEDAVALTAEFYADEPEADLRTEVLPRFYATLVGHYCAYLDAEPAGVVGPRFDGGQPG